MVGDVEEAMKAYKRCQEKLESDGEPVPADVLVKMAWVCMDKEDTSEVRMKDWGSFAFCLSLYYTVCV